MSPLEAPLPVRAFHVALERARTARRVPLPER